RVNVTARVDVHIVQLGLFRRHIFQSPNEHADFRVDASFGQLWPNRFGHAEVNHLRYGLAVIKSDQDVGRLQVAMNDSLLMSVLHAVTDRYKQFESLSGRQPGLVTILGDRDALNQLHDEIGPSIDDTGVEDLGYVGMVHQGQGPAFLLESSQHAFGV